MKVLLDLKGWLHALVTGGDAWQRLLWPWATPSNCLVRLEMPVESDEPHGSGTTLP